MAKNFAYRARDQRGSVQNGLMAAENEIGVANFIRSKGWFVVEIKEKKETSISFDLSKFKKVSVGDLAIYTRQFSAMIDAGLPLVNTLNILEQQTLNPKLKLATAEVYKAVQNGESLSKAMAKHSQIFPQLMVSMVEAGEVGGVLDTVMQRLAGQFEKDQKMNAKVKGAMTYPVVVLCVAFLIVTGIITFILPNFARMFEDIGVQLPLPTRILMGLSSFFAQYWWLMLFLLGGAIFGFGRWASTETGKRRIDEIMLRLPLFGELVRKVAIARFSRTLGTLLQGGVGIIQALDVVKRVAGNYVIANAIAGAQVSIKEGQGLTAPLKESKVFTPMALQMMAIGEETGSLDRLLEKVADMFENEVDEVVGGLSKIIEPLLMVFLGGIIGGIVLAIFMPMFEIMNAVH